MVFPPDTVLSAHIAHPPDIASPVWGRRLKGRHPTPQTRVHRAKSKKLKSKKPNSEKPKSEKPKSRPGPAVLGVLLLWAFYDGPSGLRFVALACVNRGLTSQA
jgi:hypothetical protein